MKVILTEDVKSLGKKGQIVEINDGYARNFVLAKKLGVEANSKNLNDLKLKNAHNEKVAKEEFEAAKVFAAEIKDKIISVPIKVGENGKTFGSVSSKEIAEQAKKQFSVTIDKKKIVLPEAIKTVGTQIVPYKIHPKVTAELTVKVIEE